MADFVLDLPPGDRFVVKSYNPDGSPRGKLIFSGDELEIHGLDDDPPKLRLASRAGAAISASHIRGDGGQEEYALLQLKPEPGNFGGNVMISTRARYSNGDGAMRLAAAFGTEYGVNDRVPSARMITPGLDLGPLEDDSSPPLQDPPFDDSVPPPPDPGGGSSPPAGSPGLPSAVISTANFHPSSGAALDCLRSVGDPSKALIASEPLNTDAEAVVTINATDKTQIKVECHRTTLNGEAPFLSIYIDGTLVLADFRPQADWSHVALADIPVPGEIEVRVHVAAGQGGGGAVNIGSISAI